MSALRKQRTQKRARRAKDIPVVPGDAMWEVRNTLVAAAS